MSMWEARRWRAVDNRMYEHEHELSKSWAELNGKALTFARNAGTTLGGLLHFVTYVQLEFWRHGKNSRITGTYYSTCLSKLS